MTQAEVASPEYTGAYISTIEAGRRTPSHEALSHFAARLGVEVEEILSGRPSGAARELEDRLSRARSALSDGRLHEAGKSLLGIAKDARRFRLPTLQARAHEYRGLLLERQGKSEDAFAQYQTSEKILLGESASSRADAVAGEARCLEALGDVRYAIHLLETTLGKLQRERGADTSALAQLHASLLDAYLEAGLLPQAAAQAAELERVGARVKEPLRIGQMNMHLAHLYLIQGRADAAEAALGSAEDAYEQLGLYTETGYARLARGYLFNRQGRLDEARQELEAAVGIFEHTGDAKDLARSLNELARVERLEERPHRAIGLLERSSSLIQDEDVPTLAWARREIGLTYMTDDPAMAEKHLREAIRLYESTDEGLEVAATYGALGDLLRATDQVQAAGEAYRAGVTAIERDS